ncbi:MAG: alpha-D-glucose phosphate-specific phosphoglucomutase [Alphaproteobacteria bacterium]|nr:alpha-D-glucose phosphate-specific phosphoglucomutase [Alphaproteobacteria bacterium]
MHITSVATKAYPDQQFGTSGLRKRTQVFMQHYYIHNVIQSIFDSLKGFEGKTLIIGGDGRYLNSEAIQIAIKIAVANGFGTIIVGRNGWMSTPALSHLINKYEAFGGIIFTASHNPGGKDGDFGIKYDDSNGAPAPLSLTSKISERTKGIDRFWWADIPDLDLSVINEYTFDQAVVKVINPVTDYAEYMAEIFDFEAIQKLFASGFTMTFDALNGITGPYAKYIFEEQLGAAQGTVVHGKPLPDFGGCHPDPNLVYAKDLVDSMFKPETKDFAAASDGDGDRHMILAPNLFINPADSLAILTEYLELIPFYKGKMYGVARSMPTAPVVDDVAVSKKIPLYVTPTGWKFFANLLASKKVAVCGEESFGAGSFHVMEKDGIWAILAWLNIIAKTHKKPQELTYELWTQYGRTYRLRHDYEGVDSGAAQEMFKALASKLPNLTGTKMGQLQIKEAKVFTYTDPITHEKASNQGIIVTFSGNASVVFRISGTGTVGATVRMYFAKKEKELDAVPAEVLAPLILTANTLLQTKKYLGLDAPTSIT